MSRRQRSTVRARGNSHFAALLALLFLPAAPCFAFSYRAMSEVEMTCAADVIVVGTHRIRDTADRHIRTIRVDEVLKGEGPAAGAEIDLSATLGRMEMATEAVHRDEPVVAWLGKADGKYHLVNFSNSLKEPTPKRRETIAHVLGVLDKPAAHLPPKDDEAAEALCHWVYAAWFEPGTRPLDRVLRKDLRETAGVTRDQVIDLLCRVGGDGPLRCQVLALKLLSAFNVPQSFDVFVAALGAKDSGMKAAAARGLKALGDRRAAPHLVRALDELPDDLTARMAICDAIGQLGDASAVPALLRQLEMKRYGGVEGALARLRDPRAVPVLLEAVWRDESGVEALLAYNDPAILTAARQRVYDHPSAPRILAARGDPTVKPLMLTLIRQRNAMGLVWARKTKDPEALAAVVVAMRDGWPTQFMIEGIGVLADVEDDNVVGALAALLPSPGYGPYAWDNLERRLRLGGGKELPARERTRRIAAALLKGSDRYRLNPRTRKWAENELKVKDGAAAAHGLPAWSDLSSGPASAEELKAQVVRHRDALGRLVRDGAVPAEERIKALTVAQAAGVVLVGQEDVDWMLAEWDWTFHRTVLDLYQSQKVRLSREQVRQLFSSPVLPVYLHNVKNAKSCEYPELLQEVIDSDWGPGVPEAFETVAAVGLRTSIPRLRSLLRDNVIGVRRNAAVALARLGDDSGRDVLEREVARHSGQKYQFYAWGHEAEHALRLIKGRSR